VLVLGRVPGQSIYIGNDIVVTVLRSQGGAIKIGITAPPEIKILREELRQTPAAKGHLIHG